MVGTQTCPNCCSCYNCCCVFLIILEGHEAFPTSVTFYVKETRRILKIKVQGDSRPSREKMGIVLLDPFQFDPRVFRDVWKWCTHVCFFGSYQSWHIPPSFVILLSLDPSSIRKQTAAAATEWSGDIFRRVSLDGDFWHGAKTPIWINFCSYFLDLTWALLEF